MGLGTLKCHPVRGDRMMGSVLRTFERVYAESNAKARFHPDFTGNFHSIQCRIQAGLSSGTKLISIYLIEMVSI